MKVRALIDYNDFQLNRKIIKGEEYDVTKERAEVLLKGNASSGNKPFVEVVKEKPVEKEITIETTDLQVDNVETATVKPKKSKKATK